MYTGTLPSTYTHTCRYENLVIRNFLRQTSILTKQKTINNYFLQVISFNDG